MVEHIRQMDIWFFLAAAHYQSFGRRYATQPFHQPLQPKYANVQRVLPVQEKLGIRFKEFIIVS